ncbi:MAG: HIT domain-containing protein [Anaerolineales bacterium]|nr:MAG: HIT domain-containing protein [Anaerolineales bacterium]
MKHLWAPWRMDYIQESSHEEGCLFCSLLAQEDGPGNLILHRGQNVFVVLNRYPYTNGHMMVVPFTHEHSLEGLDDKTLLEMLSLASDALGVLRDAYNADGFNLGANIGEAAGAGVKEHVHLHVVPRWTGDTNFMATTAETRVLPEALEVTYQALRGLWLSRFDNG